MCAQRPLGLQHLCLLHLAPYANELGGDEQALRIPHICYALMQESALAG